MKESKASETIEEEEAQETKPLDIKEEVDNFKLENKELLAYLKSNFGVSKMKVLSLDKLANQTELKVDSLPLESTKSSPSDIKATKEVLDNRPPWES
ncbi:hypothetical protein BKH43_06565 [Helicobacter sp. 13S00401-1]|uniref:hypothetical protein n=1 Tax=Helicobacter sp. 13S00401-1 TaxID=1905758 RepID=UPI000BA6A080|nr:hypothetical protein [Helicobacter sp. 13S00401-1]PAF49664.1 hypothetical protein BKH43_06565 [Helicobacter sp. 13S00401-1]